MVCGMSPRAPRHHPNEYSDNIKDQIRFLRKEGKGICADVIKIRLKKRYDIEISRSGIAGFLSREGLVNEKLSRRIKNKKQRIKKCQIHEPGVRGFRWMSNTPLNPSQITGFISIQALIM